VAVDGQVDPARHVRVTSAPIDLAALHGDVLDAGAGAILSFVGTVRDNKHGRRVLRIDYHAYDSMARRVMQRIAQDASTRWPLQRLVVVHRIGLLEVGEASVAIFLSTAHRAAGFEALRFVIEELKRDVPIWKKEHFEDGEIWVQEGP
jgi:molybdopterin synthase catalytic subunit